MGMTTIISEHTTFESRTARAEGGDLWIRNNELEEATGWTIKPEGLCRGPICVPIPQDAEAEYRRDDTVNIATFWRRLDKPFARSTQGDVWVLGEGAAERISALASLEAPDFTLPALDGTLVSLSQFRGKKVLLASWASW
jgi:hypothetical protein